MNDTPFDDTAARPLALALFLIVLAFSFGMLIFGRDAVLFWMPILIGVSALALGGWYLWRAFLYRSGKALNLSVVFLLGGTNMLFVPFGQTNWLIGFYLPLLGVQLLRLVLRYRRRSTSLDRL